ncbi:sensor histidine kinase [Haloglomus litoreum]|uniref:sensor histidine kinase n=1 Tax=Haloglomus litoreum TaxID=3034026 RepID=UPI0023E7713E|nr:HAMP domain-containing sensor histidine kinase [Haloglomus sp. DT116]
MASSHAAGELPDAVPEEAAGWAVAALGLALVTVGVAYLAASPDAALFDTAIASLPGAATTGLWFLSRRLWSEPEHQPRLLRWTLIGGTILGGLILVVVLVQGTGLRESLLLLQFMTGVGTAAGVAIGTSEARSVEAARRAERARVSAEHVREERDRLRFLNNLLRHNVLNKVQIIRAYTRDVSERHDGEFDDELETTMEQTQEIAELIENVRHLVQATTDDRPARAVDLQAAVAAAIDSVEPEAGVTIETDVPAVEVRGDDLLKYVVENLVRNGVQHHDRDDPTVRVRATVEDESVRLYVTDDGPGIPNGRKEDVLTPGEHGDSGLGLHLVRTVVEGYGGGVAIRDNEPRGTVVELTLPRTEE